jgi:D-3-phosphoglycerate dehydrogenase / 2-oxoglutarate reductase
VSNRHTSAGGRARLALLPPVLPPDLLAVLDEAPLDRIVPPTRDQDGVRRVLRDADIVLGDFTGHLRLGPEEAEAGAQVAFIQQPGVGVETVDLDAWTQRGVPVANTAGANATSVAEWCVGAAIVLLRSMTWADAEVRAGRWPQLEIAARGCQDLGARRVGIVGFGAVGEACATRFGAFGCQVSYWSRRRRPPAEEHGATYRELDDLVRTSDVLVVVIALADQTRGLIDASQLALLPRGAIVIDAARGGIVDEEALADGLDTGVLLGAAMDVFGSEPLPATSPLRGCDRILLSPHVAGATTEARARIVETIVANIHHALRGEPLESVVNGVSPVVRWRGGSPPTG